MEQEERRKVLGCIQFDYNIRLLIEGAVLACLGVAAPALIHERHLHIYDSLMQAMMQESSYILMIAAIKLVLMNAIRMLPHYLGVFLINESVSIYISEKRRFWLNALFTMSLIMLIYDVIFRIYGIRYDLGIPALMTVGVVLLLSYMDLFSVSMINKVLLVGTMLLGIQWLDVMPMLTPYKFGRGEISMDVKKAAEFIGEEHILTLFGGAMMMVLLFASIMQIQLLVKEHKLKISNEKTRQVEKELYNTQIEALKMRNFSEVQSLVHDLKSPLTTMQGLVSLAEMMEENPLIREYFQKISSSMTSMSLMISEILYESSRTRMTTEELMRMILAQISIRIPSDMLTYDNQCPKAVLRGNKIRLTRAVINLLNNAYNAVDGKNGHLVLKIYDADGYIYITVEDNGTGISEAEMKHIWELGYSGKQSTGLGLPFTRQVVENHGGTIQIESEEGKYTKAIICLKEENGDGEYKDNSGD